jgi:hypothetical protein
MLILIWLEFGGLTFRIRVFVKPKIERLRTPAISKWHNVMQYIIEKPNMKKYLLIIVLITNYSCKKKSIRKT